MLFYFGDVYKLSLKWNFLKSSKMFKTFCQLYILWQNDTETYVVALDKCNNSILRRVIVYDCPQLF